MSFVSSNYILLLLIEASGHAECCCRALWRNCNLCVHTFNYHSYARLRKTPQSKRRTKLPTAMHKAAKAVVKEWNKQMRQNDEKTKITKWFR